MLESNFNVRLVRVLNGRSYERCRCKIVRCQRQLGNQNLLSARVKQLIRAKFVCNRKSLFGAIGKRKDECREWFGRVQRQYQSGSRFQRTGYCSDVRRLDGADCYG